FFLVVWSHAGMLGLPYLLGRRHIAGMAKLPKSKSPRSSRGKSGKPAPPPSETAAGTPGTRGFAEAPQAVFTGSGTLPALRLSGPLPGRAGGENISDSLNALLAKPHERTDRAKEILARQPLMANHPIVAGTSPMFVPHRPERPEKSEGGHAF